MNIARAKRSSFYDSLTCFESRGLRAARDQRRVGLSQGNDVDPKKNEAI